MVISESNLTAVNLPIRPFLYTLDQIAELISTPVRALAEKHVYFDNRSIGAKRPWHIMARNIAGPDDNPEWRVVDRELIRWMKNRGFRYIERGYVKD